MIYLPSRFGSAHKLNLYRLTTKLTYIIIFCFVCIHVSAQNFYMCFTNDTNPKLALSVTFNSTSEKATFIKYKGQKETMLLSYLKRSVPAKGDAAYETTYSEKYHGKQTGTYIFTHSGNWDYIKYIRKKDGKIFNFTINLETSIKDDGYRKTPCY